MRRKEAALRERSQGRRWIPRSAPAMSPAHSLSKKKKISPAHSRSQLETWRRSASLGGDLEPGDVRAPAISSRLLGGGVGKWSAGGKALAVLHVASGRGQSEVNGQLGELSRS